MLVEKLESKYSVPGVLDLSEDGTALISMSAIVSVVSTNDAVKALNNKVTSERLRALQDSEEAVQEDPVNSSPSFEVEIAEELLALTDVLKLSGSVLIDIIPADENYGDKKGFKWQIFIYDQNSIGLRFTFDHPEYISAG